MFTNEEQLKKASHILKVLGHPVRIRIANLLIDGPKNVTTLNKKIKISQPALSQHLARMRLKNLVETERKEREIYYRLSEVNIIRIMAEAYETAGHA